MRKLIFEYRSAVDHPQSTGSAVPGEAVTASRSVPENRRHCYDNGVSGLPSASGVSGLRDSAVRYCGRLRTVVCGLFFLLISMTASAQYQGYRPVADLLAFKKQFALQSAKINSVTSNFTQEKVLTALTEKITSSGTFRFKRSNKVRLEYTTPFSYLMVMNGDKMMVKDEQKETHVNVKSNKLFQQINRIMIDCIQGTILDSKDFSTRVFENDKSFLLEMTPASKSLKDFFQTIVLTVEKKDYSVRSIEMNEPSADRTVITFTDKKLNEQIADEVFKL